MKNVGSDVIWGPALQQNRQYEQKSYSICVISKPNLCMRNAYNKQTRFIFIFHVLVIRVSQLLVHSPSPPSARKIESIL